jgi:hypothetical protein
VPSASVVAEVNPEGLPAYDGPTGSVQGTVYIKGDPPADLKGQDFSRCPDAAGEYGKIFRDGPALPDGRRPLADAVVVVTGYSGAYVPEKNEARTITFEGCGFSSRTITMTFGQRLDIVNQSALVFAPELREAASPAVLVPPPHGAGDPVHVYPPHPGAFRLDDKLGALPYLFAQVIVLKQPLHTVTDTAGHFRIDGIPVGKGLHLNVELAIIDKRAWRKIDVVAGVVADADMTLDYLAAPVASSSARPPVRGLRTND